MYWSRNFAYAVGLITTDGCLSSDKRHIDLTSKDIEQIENFKKILNLTNKIGSKRAGRYLSKTYYRIQFGNVKLYRYLESIGLCSNKSSVLKELKVPNRYFADFLRGCLDGDGYSYSYWDKVYTSSFRFYIGFVSASKDFLEWLQKKTDVLYKIKGTINSGGSGSEYQLKYAKKNSVKLVKLMYHSNTDVCLSRKKFKIDKALDIIRAISGSGETGIHVGPRSPCR